MIGTLGRRLATGSLTLLLVSGVVFGLVHLAPGDPLPGEDADEPLRPLTAERLAALRALYRLDRPVHEQYLLWLGDLARGDLGRSFTDQRPVRERIGERIGVTLTLNVLALGVACVVSVLVGAFAARGAGGAWDRASGVVTYALYALPVFWAALLLQILFAVRLEWLPLHGLASAGSGELGVIETLSDRAAHLVLPVACLCYGGVAYLSRFVRASLLDNAFGETSRAARARGLSTARVVFRHGLRQAAIPLLTLAGFLLPGLVGGSVIVETVFGIPGLGRLFVESVLERDLPVIMSLTLLSGTATLLGVVGADLAYAVADPRARRASP